MDKPQYQVFESDKQSYRYMEYPFQKQPLQLLYPGRFMEPYYHYTGENIPNEDPIGLALTQSQNASLSRAAVMKQEAISRYLGGTNKIVRHPVVEPEAVIEDPQLQNFSLNTSFGLGGDLDTVPSKLGNLEEVETEVQNIASDVRKSLLGSPNPLSKEDVLPRYDWKAAGVGYNKKNIETYVTGTYSGSTYVKCDGDVCATFNCSGDTCIAYDCDDSLQKCTSVTCDLYGENCGSLQECDYNTYCSSGTSSKSKSDSKTGLWIAVAVIGILAVIFIALIIYGIHKHKAHAQSMQPMTYNVVAPEYLPTGARPDGQISTYGQPQSPGNFSSYV
jgi:hypothetical protein